LKESLAFVILTLIGSDKPRTLNGHDPNAFPSGSCNVSYRTSPAFKCPLTVLYGQLEFQHSIDTLPPVLGSKNTPRPSHGSTLPNTFPPNPRLLEYQNANPLPPRSAPCARKENSASQYSCGFVILDHMAPSRWPGECGVSTIVSERRLAEPNVSKSRLAEENG
jgi:hypothetical protein